VTTQRAQKSEFEEVNCGLCGSRDYRVLLRVKDYERGLPGIFLIVSCRQCQLVFLNPRPTEEGISFYYTQDEWSRAKGAVPIEAARISRRPWRETQAFRCRPILAHRQTGAILDVGCGDGLLLKFLSEKGWECHGIEVGSVAVEYARMQGLNVREARIEEISFPENSFDAVSFFGVLEHLHHPLEALRKVSSFLKKEGILYLGGIPNFNSFERRLFGKRWMSLNAPRHLYHFTPETTALLLAKSGYRVINSGLYSHEMGVVMGYTESLRHLLSDWGLYPSKEPEDLAVSFEGGKTAKTERRPSFLLDAFHHVENTFFIGLGKLADSFGKGSNFWVIAKKI